MATVKLSGTELAKVIDGLGCTISDLFKEGI